MKKLILLIIIIFCNASFSQLDEALTLLDSNQFPYEYKWYESSNKYLRIIYTNKNKQQAFRLLSLSERFMDYLNDDLNVHIHQIPLVLNPSAVESNGYVALAPRRSEWYLVPFYDAQMGNSEWLLDLLVHEYRHVIQLDKIRKSGANKYFHFFFGELGQQIGSLFTMPRWYAEGDAVVEETELTYGGRGRQAQFNQHYRAMALDNKSITLDQDLLGSFKVYTPNFYQTGYLLVKELREKYSSTQINSILIEAANRSYNPFSFYNATKTVGGINFESFYQNTIKKFSNTLNRNKSTDQKEISPVDKVFTNYLYPQKTEDGSVVALRYGLGDIFEFVIFNTKETKVIFAPSLIRSSLRFHYNNSQIVYSDKSLHGRWNKVEYSDLAIIDIVTGKKTKLTNGQKLLHPNFNYNNSKIVAIKFNGKKSSIVVFDTDNLTLKNIKTFKAYHQPSYPVFYKDGIAYILKDESGAKSVRYISNKDEVLLEKVYDDIGDLYSDGKLLLLSATNNKVFNIAKVDNNKLDFITNDPIGCYLPSIKSKKIIYSCYRSEGYKVFNYLGREIFLNRPNQVSKNNSIQLKEWQNEKRAYKQKDYEGDGLNFHSWMLLVPPLSPIASISAYSNDYLNSISTTIGTSYHLNDYDRDIFASFTYGALPLHLLFDLSHGIRKLYSSEDLEERDLVDEWEETQASLGVKFIRNQVEDSYSKQLSIILSKDITKISDRDQASYYNLDNSTLSTWSLDLNWMSYRDIAKRDLYPRFAQSLRLVYKEGESIDGDDYKAQMKGIYSTFYFPSLKKHHSFFFELSYEEQLDSSYRYLSQLLDARGVDIGFFPNQYKTSLNYSMPVFYPDKSWGDWFYWQRISLNLFHDVQLGQRNDVNYYYRSYGAEALFDFNFLRIELPLNFGLRAVYSDKEEKLEGEVFIQTQVAQFR